MLPRSLAVVPIVRRALVLNTPAVNGLTKRFTHDHGPPANYKFPTMDDLPVPCGSWQENYDNHQRKYNLHLLFGVGVFVITLSVGIYTTNFHLYMTPDRPSEKLP